MARTKGALPQNKHIEALTWAADKANMSYGKYVQTLSATDRARIFARYRDYLEKKRRAKI